MTSHSCHICGASVRTPMYHGPIRVGRFGNVSDEPRTVWRCGGCGAGYLDHRSAIDYESSEYRELVDGAQSAAHFYALHDPEQADKLRFVGAERLRDRVVADVGCGAGSFLDLAKGVAAATLAIEPTRAYHETLSARGHVVFSYAEQVAVEWVGSVDLALCFSVVEHVQDPVALLRGIRRLLKGDGRLVLSTPNARDWLLELMPEEYAAFFYRLVHQWYFDAASLERLALRAGFSACTVTHVHRFDLSNLFLWLRDRRPTGMGRVAVSASLDAAYARWLESTGRSDYLFATLEA